MLSLSFKETFAITLGFLLVAFGAYLAITAHTGSEWNHITYAGAAPGTCVQQDVFAPKEVKGDDLLLWAKNPDNATHVKPAIELACSGGFGNVTLG